MYLIADRLTITGMRLAGLKRTYVADKDNVSGILLEASGEARIILITNALATHVRREIEKLRKAGKVIVELPDRSGAGEDFVGRMVKEVIGFDLKK
ncbi:MAG: V-type ATP synthase subunit F [Candidatus Altiarchaeota archaeon]|nr:V-type ATP synthase subunit F [Candidatus Altiarchaeota archaeon]